MTGWKYFAIFSLFFVPSTVFSKSHKYWDRDLTILLAEGAEDCYFLPNIKATNEIDIEYQVTNTKSVYTSGDLRISGRIFDPRGIEVASDDRSDYGSHSFTAQYDGDYKICLNNAVGSPGEKTVYLEVEVSERSTPKKVPDLPDLSNGEAEDHDDYDDLYNYEYDEDEYIEEDDMKNMREQDKEIMKSYDMKVSEIKTVLQELRQHIGKAQHYNSLTNSMKLKDYNLLVNSLSRVNMWSVVHIVVLIFAGLSQVYVVRSLFDDKMNMVRKVFGSGR